MSELQECESRDYKWARNNTLNTLTVKGSTVPLPWELLWASQELQQVFSFPEWTKSYLDSKLTTICVKQCFELDRNNENRL